MIKLPINIVLDTDVIVSASLSEKGASYSLIADADRQIVHKFTSSEQIKEYREVIRRLNKKSIIHFPKEFERIDLDKTSVSEASDYTHDPNDAHIIALAASSKSKFLVTYNLKDYKKEGLRRDFDLICMTPGIFLQYLRSMGF